MNWSVSFSPLLPVWITGALAIIGGALLLYGLFARVRGTIVRVAALLALTLALLNPVILREEREGLPTVVAMVVDKSPSQNLDGRDKTTEAARKALAERLAEFKGVEVRTIEAGGAAGVKSDGTELFGATRSALADVPPDRLGAVILLTDGQVHDAPAGRPDFAPGAPVHGLLSGRDNERDRRIAIDKAPRFGIVGEKQPIEYRVLDAGSPPGARVRVTISRDGEQIATETVIAGVKQTFQFEVSHGGRNILEFEAEPLEGELTAINNRAVVDLTGIRENLRVLLVSGEPHAGERTWRNLLKSDASVDLVHFTILRPPEKQDGTPINQLSLIAFPTRELFSEKIKSFDLIIFDRYQRRGVLPIVYFDNIARFVREGGALLVTGGPDYADPDSLFRTPLSTVLPAAPTGKVYEQPFLAHITDRGARHPVTRGLTGSDVDPPRWSRFFRQAAVSAPQGEVIMDGVQKEPLIILNRQGEGRVALILSDQVWLWARGFEGGGPHVDLLRRLAHWLMKEPDLEEEALRATTRGNQLTIEQQTMGEVSPPALVRSPSGAERTVELQKAEPGLYRLTIDADELGLWRIEQAGKRVFAPVGPANPREFLEVRSSPEPLRGVVEASGGRIARMADSSGELDLPRIVPIRNGSIFGGSDWMGIRMTEASVLKGIDRLPLFAGFLGLALLLGALAATWYREGR